MPRPGGVAPVRLVEPLFARDGLPVRHGRGRGCQHHAANARGAGGPERPQSAVDGGPDEFVLVPRLPHGQRRRRVHQYVHAGHGVEPAAVLVEVQVDKAQAPVEAGRRRETRPHRVAHLVPARFRPQRAHHPVARVQQLKNDVLGDEAAGAGDQCGLGRFGGGAEARRHPAGLRRDCGGHRRPLPGSSAPRHCWRAPNAPNAVGWVNTPPTSSWVGP